MAFKAFKRIRTEDYIYGDKTQFALELIEGDAPHYFLARPRRFGKSLFLSTLKEIFKGNKVLFEGCHIAKSSYNWQPYPVLHLNLVAVLNANTEKLEASLQRSIDELADEYEIEVEIPSAQEGLQKLIKSLASKGRVAVLIDEYDKPIIDNLHNLAVAEDNRRLLQAFFGVLKILINTSSSPL